MTVRTSAVEAAAPAAGTSGGPDPDAQALRNALVEANLDLAKWGVAKWAPLFARDDADFNADLLQAARVGILRAAERWDPERGAFSTCASQWMRQSIMEELKRHDLVRIPSYFWGDARARARARFAPLGLAEAGSCIDRQALDPAAGLEAEERAALQTAFLKALLRRLPARTREVLRLRFWGGLKLSEVGERLGITKERVRQVQAGGLAKLRVMAAENEERGIGPCR